MKSSRAATLVGLGDRQGVGGRQEEEVVDQRAGGDGEERRPEAEADGDADDGGQEHEVERLDADQRLDQLDEREGDGDREERDGVGARVEAAGGRAGPDGLRRDRVGRGLVAGDDVDADAAGEAHEVVDDRAVQELEPARAGGLADDDLGDVLGAGVGEHVLGDGVAAAGQRQGLAAEALGEAEGVGDAVARRLGQLGGARRLDGDGGPGGVQPVGEALGVADEAGGGGVLADADEDALAGGPGAGDGVGAHVGEELGVDALGGAAERELAQRGEVAGGEVVRERAARGLADVDLALLQALDQVVGGDVDDLDVVGAVDDRVGHRLADADAGDLGDDVVEALDVLDVDGGVDVDAGGEQLLDVEVALGVAAAGGVGVGELVDEGELRACGRGWRRGPSPRGRGRGSRSGGAGSPRSRGRAPGSRRGRGSRRRR